MYNAAVLTAKNVHESAMQTKFKILIIASYCPTSNQVERFFWVSSLKSGNFYQIKILRFKDIENAIGETVI